MQLYDVFYFGNAMDSNVALPAPSNEIRYVRNTNWDHHEMAPEYDTATHDAILAEGRAKYGVAPYGARWRHVGTDEGQISAADFAEWLKIVAGHRDFYGEIEQSGCARVWVEMGKPTMLRWPIPR